MPSNVILTNAGSVSLPDPPVEGAVMSEAPDFPRIFYHPTEPSRIFESAEELRAAGSGWVKTPTEAADAAAKASTAQSGPQESTSTDEGSSAPRSRR